LDDLIGGGIEARKSILFSGQPGIDEASFAQQLLFYRLQKGDHCLYLVNNKVPRIVKARLKEFDWDIEKYDKEGIFSFFDCYSGFMGIASEEKFSSPLDLKEVWKRLIEALEKIKNNNTILIVDSLSTFIDLFDTDKLISAIQELIKKSKELNVTPVFLFTEWPYDKKLKLRIKGMFDCIIELKAIEKTIFLRNYFTISKVDWLKELDKIEIPFKIVQPGGIKVYIPKILVTGPYNAGKSSFVHSASTKAVSVERIGLEEKGTTIALDHGHVDYKGFTADLFGTPGQERFDPLLEMLGGESLGVIVLIDSTAPETFERAKEMAEKTKTKGLPSIVVANKANLKGALRPEQIRKKMNLPKEIPIVPVIAESLKAIREGMKKKKICRLRKEDVNKVLDNLFKATI
jgi:hypothetical protein